MEELAELETAAELPFLALLLGSTLVASPTWPFLAGFWSALVVVSPEVVSFFGQRKKEVIVVFCDRIDTRIRIFTIESRKF